MTKSRKAKAAPRQGSGKGSPAAGSSAGSERRELPRLKIATDDEWINTVPDFLVLDLSASGAGLSSTYPLKKGDTVTITSRDGTSVEATVVACRMKDPTTEYLSPEFRIGCKFLNDSDGLNLIERMHD